MNISLSNKGNWKCPGPFPAVSSGMLSESFISRNQTNADGVKQNMGIKLKFDRKLILLQEDKFLKDFSIFKNK